MGHDDFYISTGRLMGINYVNKKLSKIVCKNTAAKSLIIVLTIIAVASVTYYLIDI
jgi:predicted PurR-regulated permease PerM